MRPILARFACLLSLPFVLSACGTWLGESEAPPLPGNRVAVLVQEKAIEADPALAKTIVRLPKPEENIDWPQTGGRADHALQHLKVADAPRVIWSADIGSGLSSSLRLLAHPVMAQNRIFAMDTEGTVSSIDARTGKKVWTTNILPKNQDRDTAGGGLAFEGGRLFIATPFAELLALDAANGAVVWRQSLPMPARGAPTVKDGRIFALTVDNQTLALSTETGKVLWTHQGISETAGLLGTAAPAVEDGVVVVPYSSGEIFALRAENGSVLWADALSAIKRTNALTTIADIRALPVIDQGRVYAIGHADLMVAIDIRSGQRVWEKEIGGTQTPWVAGDYIFTLTNESQMVALEAKTGKVRWVTSLPRWENEKKRRGLVIWSGPVLIGNRLVATSSYGAILSVSPYDGHILGTQKMKEGVTQPPIVAAQTVFFLTDDGDLVAYR